MFRLITLISTLSVFCLFASSVNAHHSTVALFHGDQTIEVTGVIEQISWRNPHGYILFSVDDESGDSEENADDSNESESEGSEISSDIEAEQEIKESKDSEEEKS